MVKHTQDSSSLTGAEVRISGNGLKSKGSISLAIERSHRCAIESHEIFPNTA